MTVFLNGLCHGPLYYVAKQLVNARPIIVVPHCLWSVLFHCSNNSSSDEAESNRQPKCECDFRRRSWEDLVDEDGRALLSILEFPSRVCTMYMYIIRALTFTVIHRSVTHRMIDALASLAQMKCITNLRNPIQRLIWCCLPSSSIVLTSSEPICRTNHVYLVLYTE